jgi:LPS sulfotransferase NodH
MINAMHQDTWSNRNHEEAFIKMNHALQELRLEQPRSDDSLSAIPIIYVIGAPRSGTTLLSQVLCRCLDIGYVNNVIARFWGRPSLGIYLSQALGPSTERANISFDSVRGETSGAAGPHEFGHYWTYWFDLSRADSHHLTDQESVRVDWKGLKASLRNEILWPFGIPVLFKNSICGFQARMLEHIHPASLFVHIRRDPLETCVSIARSRIQKFGTIDRWWSLRPQALTVLPQDPIEQIVKQVVESRRELSESLSSLQLRPVNLYYEEFSANPAETVKSVTNRLADAFSCEVHADHVPLVFDTSLPSQKDPSLAAQILRYLKDYDPRYE